MNDSNLMWNKSFSAPDISMSSPLFGEQQLECNPKFEWPSFSPAFNRHLSHEQLPTANNINSMVIGTPTYKTLCVDVKNDSPMEVDCQTNDYDLVESQEVQVKQPTILDYVDICTYHGSTPIMRKKTIRKTRRKSGQKVDIPVKLKRSYKFYLKCQCAAIILGLILIQIYDKLNYNRKINVENIKINLTELVICQDEAVAQLNSIFDKFDQGVTTVQFLLFMGTSGVGKTHSINIIKREFMPKQIYEVDIANVKDDEDIITSNKNVPFLIIFDGLMDKDIPKLNRLLNKLPTDKLLLVIAVFNIKETNDMKSFSIKTNLLEDIPKQLSQLGHRFDEITFHPIRFEDLKNNWVKFRKVYFHIIGNIPDIETELKKHDFKNWGFKGLFEKLQLINN